MPFKIEDGNAVWKPNNPKQLAFLSLPLTIREAMFGGGAGSGKSEILLMYGVVHGWHEHPRFKQVFQRRTYKELKNEVVGRSRDMYSRLGATFNKSDLVWTFPRTDQFGSGFSNEGAQIFFMHCENEDDVHNFDSMEINLYTPDEVTSNTEYIYSYIGYTRVRSSAPGELPAIIRASGMPGDIGHGWVKKKFVDPAPNGNKIIIGRGNNKRIYIHSTAKDNKNVDPNYVQGLSNLNEAERRAKEEGDWSSFEGSVFDELRVKRIPEEPENALHVIPEFLIPKHWPRLCAIDWGFRAMCSIGWGAISPTRRLYVYRHQIFYGKKIEEWAPEVLPYIDSDQPHDIVICHSANQHRGDPHTILEQVVAALNFPVRLGERDRLGGKQLIHEYLRWKVSSLPPGEVAVYDDELAKYILRNHGEKKWKEYLTSFNPEPRDENIPKLQFLDRDDVKVIWEALKACNYEKSDKSGKKVEDVAEFDGDDPYDMLRMLVYSADKYFEEAVDLQKKLESRESLDKQFENSADISQYYRNLRKLEHEEIIQPIPRFHSKGRRIHTSVARR